jgi:hypothetical protein
MTLLRTVTVEVNLNASASVSTTVFDYEVPVLEEMHGASDYGGIKEVSAGALEVDTDDAAGLYEQLKARYRGKAGEDAMRVVYPSLRSFEAALKASAVKPEKAAKEKVAKEKPAEDAEPEAKD